MALLFVVQVFSGTVFRSLCTLFHSLKSQIIFHSIFSKHSLTCDYYYTTANYITGFQSKQSSNLINNFIIIQNVIVIINGFFTID